MMTIEEHIAYWIEGSERDLKSAESNFQSGNYDWCLFIGHLVLEKMLKALYVKNIKGKTPPRIHNLIRLSSLAKIELNPEVKSFFDEVNDFHLETRYPDYKKEFYKMANNEFTKMKFNKIKEYYLWLRSLMK